METDNEGPLLVPLSSQCQQRLEQNSLFDSGHWIIESLIQSFSGQPARTMKIAEERAL